MKQWLPSIFGLIGVALGAFVFPYWINKYAHYLDTPPIEAATETEINALRVRLKENPSSPISRDLWDRIPEGTVLSQHYTPGMVDSEGNVYTHMNIDHLGRNPYNSMWFTGIYDHVDLAINMEGHTLEVDGILKVQNFPTFAKTATFHCPSEYKTLEICDKNNKVLMRINLEGDVPVCETP